MILVPLDFTTYCSPYNNWCSPAHILFMGTSCVKTAKALMVERTITRNIHIYALSTVSLPPPWWPKRTDFEKGDHSHQTALLTTSPYTSFLKPACNESNLSLTRRGRSPQVARNLTSRLSFLTALVVVVHMEEGSEEEEHVTGMRFGLW